MRRLLMATAGAFLALATAASAAEFVTPINQASLDAFGTSTFGVINTSTGAFIDTFTFTTGGPRSASSFVGTISLASGAKDIDFSAIDLDGLFPFVNTSGDPSEQWD